MRLPMARWHNRPSVSLWIRDSVLTVTNSGPAPVEITELRVVSAEQHGTESQFPAGALYLERPHSTLAASGEPIVLNCGDSLHGVIGAEMIQRPSSSDKSVDVRATVRLKNRPSPQLSNIASYNGCGVMLKTHDATIAERELRAILSLPI
ncbi:hypothetical protein GCM10022234_12360 [Aeromicrobium panaciterrae]|uniref:hypothetical protein n=1 Tax=Aeromicrobium panaciterrae TaxID=363861 RepID=UPI0031D19952